jgi:hypothetical protein
MITTGMKIIAIAAFVLIIAGIVEIMEGSDGE